MTVSHHASTCTSPHRSVEPSSRPPVLTGGGLGGLGSSDAARLREEEEDGGRRLRTLAKVNRSAKPCRGGSANCSSSSSQAEIAEVLTAGGVSLGSREVREELAERAAAAGADAAGVRLLLWHLGRVYGDKQGAIGGTAAKILRSDDLMAVLEDIGKHRGALPEPGAAIREDNMRVQAKRDVNREQRKAWSVLRYDRKPLVEACEEFGVSEQAMLAMAKAGASLEGEEGAIVAEVLEEAAARPHRFQEPEEDEREEDQGDLFGGIYD